MTTEPKTTETGTPAPVRTPEASDLLGKLNEVGSEFLNTQEWGVFKADAAGKLDALETEIIQDLERCRTNVDKGDLPAAQTALLKARSLLLHVQKRRPLWYVANNRFGLVPLVITLAAVSLAFAGLFWGWDTHGNDVHRSVMHAAFLGLAGATLKALYWLQFQINKGALRPRWLAYFAVAPFIGVLLGAISYLIVLVGFKLVTGGKGESPEIVSISLFAAFSGFNWEWALDKFALTADAVAKFGDKKSNGKK